MLVSTSEKMIVHPVDVASAVGVREGDIAVAVAVVGEPLGTAVAVAVAGEPLGAAVAVKMGLGVYEGCAV